MPPPGATRPTPLAALSPGIPYGMTHRLLRTSWAPAARGAAAFAFGLTTLVHPSLTVTTFARLFAAFAVFDGLAAGTVPLRLRRRGRDDSAVRDPVFVLAAAGAALGVLAAVWPDLTVRTLLALVAGWAAVAAAGHLLVARGRPRPPAWYLFAGAAALAAALAVSVLLALAAGEVRVGWGVGVYGLASALLLAAAAWRLRLAVARQPRRRAGDDPRAAGAPLGDAPDGDAFAAAPAAEPLAS